MRYTKIEYGGGSTSLIFVLTKTNKATLRPVLKMLTQKIDSRTLQEMETE